MMALFQIGYDNLCTRLTPTASSAAATAPAINLKDWHGWSRWTAGTAGTSHTVTWDAGSGNTASADYAAIYGHDLVTGDSIVVESSPNGSTWTTQATILPAASVAAWDAPAQSILCRFAAAVAVRYWRLRWALASSRTPSLSVAAMGALMTSERGAHVGMMPLRSGRRIEQLNSTSDAGHFLGRSLVDRGVAGKIDLEPLTPAWVESTWMPFSQHAQSYPFFLAWPPLALSASAGVVLAWSTEAISGPEHSSTVHMRAGLSWQGKP